MGVAMWLLLLTSCYKILCIAEGFTLPLQSVHSKFEPITNKRQTVIEEVYKTNVNLTPENCNIIPIFPLDLAQSVALEPCLFIANNVHPNIFIEQPYNPQFYSQQYVCPMDDTELRVDLLPNSICESPIDVPLFLETNDNYATVVIETEATLKPIPILGVPEPVAFFQPVCSSYLEPHLTVKMPVTYATPPIDAIDRPLVLAESQVPYALLDITTPAQYITLSPSVKTPGLEWPFSTTFLSSAEPNILQAPEIFIDSSFQIDPSTEIESGITFDPPPMVQLQYLEQPCDYYPNLFVNNPNNNILPADFLFAPFEPQPQNLELNLCLNIEPETEKVTLPFKDLSTAQFLIPFESYAAFEPCAPNMKREITQCCDISGPLICSTPRIPLASNFNNISPLVDPIYLNPPLSYYDCDANFIPTPSTLCNPCIYHYPPIPSYNPYDLESIIIPNALPVAINNLDPLPVFPVTPGITFNLASTCAVTSSPACDFVDVSSINSFSPIPIVQTGFPTPLKVEPFPNDYSQPLFDLPQHPYILDLPPLNQINNPNIVLPPVQIPQRNTYSSINFSPTLASSLPQCTGLSGLSTSIVPSSYISSTSPISKYFDEVRCVTAKLNDFITSFNNRLSTISTVRTPRTLSQPSISPYGALFDPPNTYYGYDSAVLVSPLSNYDNPFSSAPRVPLFLQNDVYKYPTSSSVSYNNFQETINALSYSNLPYSNKFAANQRIPETSFLSKTSFPAAPLVPKIPFGGKNFDRTESTILLTDIISSISNKGSLWTLPL